MKQRSKLRDKSIFFVCVEEDDWFNMMQADGSGNKSTSLPAWVILYLYIILIIIPFICFSCLIN